MGFLPDTYICGLFMNWAISYVENGNKWRQKYCDDIYTCMIVHNEYKFFDVQQFQIPE